VPKKFVSISRRTSAWSPRTRFWPAETPALLTSSVTSCATSAAASMLYNAGLTSTTIATLMPCVDRPSAASTRETIALMEREHERLGQQVADLVTTREQLAYLLDLTELAAS